MVLDEIRRLCKEQNITVADLEKNVGLSNGAVGKWANSSPRVDSLKAVADFFGVTVDDLLEGRMK